MCWIVSCWKPTTSGNAARAIVAVEDLLYRGLEVQKGYDTAAAGRSTGATAWGTAPPAYSTVARKAGRVRPSRISRFFRCTLARRKAPVAPGQIGDFATNCGMTWSVLSFAVGLHTMFGHCSRAQTGRRGDAGPAGACLAVRTPPATFSATSYNRARSECGFVYPPGRLERS